MTKEIAGHKDQYNKLLLRHENAVMYLDNTKVPAMQKEKWLPEFEKLIEEMNWIICVLEADGYVPTTQEILNGFREEILL